MKTSAFLSVFASLSFFCSCQTHTGESNDSASVKDTTYLKDTNIKLELLTAEQMNNVLRPDQPISWDDFKADSMEFDRLRKTIAAIRDAKTVLVRYDIDELGSYLNFLKRQHIDSVDIFLGKYVNAASQPSGTTIPVNHRGRLTVMIAGKGTSKETTPFVMPYNVGSPWP